MLPSGNRLNLSRISFKKFGGQRIISEEFNILAKDASELKVAVIVSKKVASKAVDRNRIKRIVIEALEGQKIFKGEIIVTVKKNLATLKSGQVQAKLGRLINKL